MRRSTSRRAATRPRFDRRLIGVAAAVVVFGGLIGVTQISNAGDKSGPEKVNGLEILANDCGKSRLAPHDGFQKGERCVSTEFGEVGPAEKNPTLLITEAPKSVRAGESFQLKVSTRNLVRDRFLAAGQGGYYVESSVLTPEGLVRGHFHTACRMLSSTRAAVDPAPVPAFFVATEDRRGGAQPDTVTIQVPGLPDDGIAQCASWAGDGSHRIPMMQRANQTPAFDAVRIRVERGRPPADDEDDEDDENDEDNPPAPGDGEGNGDGNAPGDGNDDGNAPGDGNGDGDGNPPGDGDGDGDGNPPAQDGGNQPNPVATKPTTKTSTRPAKPPADKPATQDKPREEADRDEADRDEADRDEADRAESGRGDEDAETAQAVRPKPSATARKGAVKKESTDETEDAEQAPAAELQSQQDAAVLAEPAPPPADDSPKLALTGVNTIAIAGAGLLLILGGVVLFGSLRRRRAESGWR
ncbi:hypothetical protein [Jidongwangia harbinensis]|uniref:hypothetical protein n=1 Tax=Jidongwangia harbinensis TaxID=2878561 RepID=UPI003555CDC7